jgi:energy-coupling factor transporter ATP-binding protein EcfA2
MKNVLALYGRASVGKSSVIRAFYQLLKNRYPDLIILSKPPLCEVGDIRVAVNINGIIIGIEGQGDPNSRIFETIDTFVEINVDIIVCTTRTRGATSNKVEELKTKGFKIDWIFKKPEEDENQHEASNALMAAQLLAKIETLLNSSKI